MKTVPNTGKKTRDQATILPINPGSDGESTSPPPDDGGNGHGSDTAGVPRRLTFTVDEAAFLLNISRGLAYELVARGELDSIRLGRRIVIPRIVLEKLTGATIT